MKKKLLLIFLIFFIQLNAKTHTLSICAIFQNEADYLKQWIEYHKSVGVDHFYLYNNNSTDHFQKVLHPYIKKGIVTLTHWPDCLGTSAKQDLFLWTLSTQIPAYENAVRLRADQTRWLMFVNADEFVVLKEAQNLAEILEKYEESPGVILPEAHVDHSFAKHLSVKMEKTIFKPECYNGFTLFPGKCRFKGKKKASLLSAKEAQVNFRQKKTNLQLFNSDFLNSSFSVEETERLLLKKQIPKWIKEQLYCNLLSHIKALPNARSHRIDVSLPLIQDQEQYHLTNPSIQKIKDGYKVICRAVNYTQIGAKEFTSTSSDGMFRTKNFLIEYDMDLRPISQREIVENLPRSKTLFTNIEGLEDCRIFHLLGEEWFTCSTTDTSPHRNVQISLCKLGEIPNKGPVQVERLTPLIGPDPFLCEKNWLPFVRNGHFYTIYSYDPFVILKPDIQTGECEIALEYDPAHDFSSFRGSAGPIEWEEGLLLLIHEVVFLSDASRVYLHRFLCLDSNDQVTHVSNPFYFQHLGVEYCCGMTLDHSGKELLMTVGVEDKEAFFYSVNLSEVKKSLKKLIKKF